jgi:catechol 2,3-dioxygenase-like lactoylglutathione lyase family enzyme
MTHATIGNHVAMVMPVGRRQEIRAFYCDVLGCEITRESERKDDLQLGEDFHFGFLYGDFAEESEFLRSGKAMFLELKSDDVEELRRSIIEAGITVLDVPDPHLYFQAPGGQVFRLVGIDEDLSAYERGSDPGSASAVIQRAEDSKAEEASRR